jgi:hypothetical protein
MVPGVAGGRSPLAVNVVVDGANVMGSRPDGWWRDRAGAAARLHADLVRVAEASAGTEYVLVLEGAARAAVLEASDRVRVVLAPASGDDAIVDVVRSLSGDCAVVSADRELRRRCAALGATLESPGWLLRRF